MKYSLIIFITLLLFNCNNNSPEKIFKEANEYRKNKNLKDAIISYENIIDNYPMHNFASKAQFQIADIYLNDLKEYDYAIDIFKKIISEYPNTEVAKKSLFMSGYVYNNYLNAYSDAIEMYTNFQSTYPEDNLIPSVEYELEGLEVINIKIDSLKNIK